MLRAFLLQSADMLRKYGLYVAAGLAVIVLALLAGLAWRPIIIQFDEKNQQIHALVWTTGQALQAAQINLDPADMVEPGIHQAVPLNGKIQIRRVGQVYLWQANGLKRLGSADSSPTHLLEQSSIPIGAADRLTWNGLPIPPEQPLPQNNGQNFILQLTRARSLVLDINGQRKTVTTNAATAAQALWEAGVHLSPGDALSTSPETPLNTGQTGPLVIAYQSAQPLIIQVGKKQIHARSTAEQVGQALADAGISLQGLDFSEPAEDQALPKDGKIRVVRVREKVNLKETLLPYEQKTTYDTSLEMDQRKILQAGQMGVQVTRERVRIEDEKEVARVVDSDWTASEPVAETVGVGSKVAAKALDAPNGKIEYWRAVNVYATSYSPCNQGTGKCSYSTSSGMHLQKGVIAVTSSWYHIIGGLRVYVPGYGTGVIADIGGGIPGKPWIDLGFDENSFASQAFTGWTTLYFLMPAPENTSWVLP